MRQPMSERLDLRRDSVHPRRNFKDGQTTVGALDDQGDGRGEEGWGQEIRTGLGRKQLR